MRKSINEKVAVVLVTFNCQNFYFQIGTNLLEKQLEPCFYFALKDFTSVPWTENKMIVDQRYCCSRSSIFLIHIHIVSIRGVYINEKSEKTRLSSNE